MTNLGVCVWRFYLGSLHIHFEIVGSVLGLAYVGVLVLDFSVCIVVF